MLCFYFKTEQHKVYFESPSGLCLDCFQFELELTEQAKVSI